jgi:hypothetical protein
MGTSPVPYGRSTQKAPAVKEVHIVWITAGLGCDGDSVSITAATQPSVEDVLFGAIPGLPKVHLHNPVLAVEVGDDFMKFFYQAEEGKLDPFVLVVEGSIPNESIKNCSPAFNDTAVVDLSVPCTFDFNVAATKYFHGLADGDVPLAFLFSGTVFYADGAGALQVAPIPWDKESRFRLPVKSWREVMDVYYPNSAWLCLRRDVFERLYQFKVEHGILPRSSGSRAKSYLKGRQRCGWNSWPIADL